MARTARENPVREEIREEATAPVKKKERVRKGAGRDELAIPQEMIPEGVDLQWVTDSVLGQASPQVRMGFEINAWEPVTGEMWEGRFDGMFMKKGHKGEINVGGLVLMWRPLELTMEAHAEQRQAAREAVVAQERELKTGNIKDVNPDMLDPRAPNAYSKLTKEIVRGMPIPK